MIKLLLRWNSFNSIEKKKQMKRQFQNCQQKVMSERRTEKNATKPSYFVACVISTNCNSANHFFRWSPMEWCTYSCKNNKFNSHSPNRRHLFSIYCLSRLCLVIWSYSWMSDLKNKIVMNKMTPNMTQIKKNCQIYFVRNEKKKLSYVSITRSKYAAKYVSFDFIAMLFLSRQILVANFHAKHSKW